MLISFAPPPLPHHIGLYEGVATLCPTGLGFDPISLIGGGILGPITSFLKTKSDEKIAKKQIQLQAAQLRAEKEQAAREYALTQAQSLAQPSADKRRDQIIALSAVGGAAVLISGLLIMAAAKARRTQ